MIHWLLTWGIVILLSVGVMGYFLVTGLVHSIRTKGKQPLP